MITQIDCRFDFHPVGQGLFYSGRVKDFHFVYDCGTDSGARYSQAAIDAYEGSTSLLDLLIISHFHADHMNAVKDLLIKTKGVREVILPYLFPAERLMLAAGYAIANDLDVLQDDYIVFLNDPVRYLRENGAPEADITFLPSGDPVTEWRDPQEQAPEDLSWYPVHPLDPEDFPELTLRSDHVKVRAHDSIYRIPFWGFKFYCQPGNATRTEIEAKLNSRIPPIKLDDVDNVIRNRLDDLKAVYHSLFHGSAGQNSTSLICCHGPIMPRGIGVQRHHCISRICIRLSQSQHMRGQWVEPAHCFVHSFRDSIDLWHASGRRSLLLQPMQLLTGDANLKLKEFQTHFNDELKAIGLTHLPHHGSRHNWGKDLPAIMPNCQFWVASFGLGNRHKHPNKWVVDAINKAKRKLMLCNEVQGIAIHADG